MGPKRYAIKVFSAKNRKIGDDSDDESQEDDGGESSQEILLGRYREVSSKTL